MGVMLPMFGAGLPMGSAGSDTRHRAWLSLPVASAVMLLKALERRGARATPNGRTAVGWRVVRRRGNRHGMAPCGLITRVGLHEPSYAGAQPASSTQRR
jgi:hypothetical protein